MVRSRMGEGNEIFIAFFFNGLSCHPTSGNDLTPWSTAMNPPERCEEHLASSKQAYFTPQNQLLVGRKSTEKQIVEAHAA